MPSLTQRLPIGQEIPSFPVSAYSPPNELLSDWTPFFQLLAQAEQRMRQIAREEFQLMAAEQIAAAAEVEKNEKLLTVNQVADILGVRPQTVYEWNKANKLNALRTGKGNRTLRFKRGDVYAALHAQTQPDGRRKYARRVCIVSPQKVAKGGAGQC